MTAEKRIKTERGTRLALILILSCYAAARVLEVLTSAHPTTTLVAVDVGSALAFALVDGTRRWGLRGILVFVTLCSIIGNGMENLGIATGFPYGHYDFLSLMGPKLFRVPVLLGLAYIGMAYVSWTLASAMLNPRGNRLAGARIYAVTLIAVPIMVAWDVAQDPVWSTVLRAWAWYDGGSWFGVPITNYFGWCLTVFLIYTLFAVYLSRVQTASQPVPTWPALAFYLLCAAGNVLQLLSRPAPPTVFDPTGRAWQTGSILAASALVSIFLMGAFGVIAAAQISGGGRKTAEP
jgi:putative membrane protein